MEKTTRARVDVLDNAQDLSIVKNLGNGNFIYAAKPSLEVQRHLYKLSISNPNDKKVPVFQRFWMFDDQKGITGSNTYLALRFDKLALRPSGLWLPGLLEVRSLDRQGKLENGVYGDYGLIVHNGETPNKEIAIRLVSDARNLKLALPLIVPFKALDYKAEGKEVRPYFVEAPQGVISGKEAKEKIGSLNYSGDSGIQRLGRIRDGSLVADWSNLNGSDVCGRVDWVCGEATRDILESAYEALLKRKYGETMIRERKIFKASLNQ